MVASNFLFFFILVWCWCLSSLTLISAVSVTEHFNESYWSVASPTFRSVVNDGHHTRCAFGTNVLEQFVAATLSVTRPTIGGSDRAPLRPFIYNWDYSKLQPTLFDACLSPLDSFSTVLDEAAPAGGGGQYPNTVYCHKSIIPTPAERAMMFTATLIGIERLKAIIKDVAFIPRTSPLVLSSSEMNCRLSSAFPKALSFKTRENNLAIVVSAVPFPQSNRDGERFWRDVLAWAAPCAYDNANRPLVVRINFNVLKLRRMMAARLTDHIIAEAFHQLLHGVGFGGKLTSNEIGSGSVFGKLGVPRWTRVPKVLLQSQYGCSDENTPFYFDDHMLTPSTLRPSPGYVAHFEPRIVARDAMSSGRGALFDLSAATLAFFDSFCPYYSLWVGHELIKDPSVHVLGANTSLPIGLFERRGIFGSLDNLSLGRCLALASSPLRFRTVLPVVNAGCGIHTSYCNTEQGGAGTLFCLPSTPSAEPDSNIVCRRDRAGLSGCQIREYLSPAVPYLSPFSPSAPDLGGFSPESDYCPFLNESLGGTEYTEQNYVSCSSSSSSLLPEMSGSSFGPNARCFESSVLRFSSKRIPFNARCYETRCYLGVVVQVKLSTLDGDTFISCPSDGSAGKVNVDLITHAGYVSCRSFDDECGDRAVHYIPFDVTFSTITNISGYPFEIGLLPHSEFYTRRQSIAICALFNASVIAATDWRVLSYASANPRGVWVQFRSDFGLPSSVSPQPNSNCTVFRNQQITVVDCASAVAGIGCTRRLPSTKTSPCAVGAPCLFSSEDPSLSAIFVIPNGTQRVVATKAVDLCSAYGGARVFTADLGSLETYLTELRKLFGKGEDRIYGLWTGFTSANFNGNGNLLRPGATDVGCIVLSQLSPKSALTLHVTSCEAEFEALCVVRDQPTPSPPSTSSGSTIDDSALQSYRAVVPRTYDRARAYCASGGGVIAPFWNAAHLAEWDAWLAGSSPPSIGSVSSGGVTDQLTTVGSPMSEAPRISRRCWAGVRPLAQDGQFRTELYSNVRPNRFLPSDVTLESLGLVFNETVYRTASVGGGGAMWAKARAAFGESSAISGLFVDSMPVAFFSCAFVPSAQRQEYAYDVSRIAFNANLTYAPFHSARGACAPSAEEAASEAYSQMFMPFFGQLSQPLSNDLFAVQGLTADVARYFISEAEAGFGASSIVGAGKPLSVVWTGLVYSPSEDRLAYVRGPAGSPQFVYWTDREMASMKGSGMWPPANVLSDYRPDEILPGDGGYLCVHLQFRGSKSRLGTSPCKMPLPHICLVARMFYGGFTPIRSASSPSPPSTSFDTEFSQVQCRFNATPVTRADAAYLCNGVLGGGLLQLPIVLANGTSAFSAMDLLSNSTAVTKFPSETRMWFGATRVTYGSNSAPTGVRYGTSAAPFFMPNFYAAWSSGGVGGSECNTVRFSPQAGGGGVSVSAESRGCAETNPFVCCVNVPRVWLELLTKSIRSGAPIQINFTMPSAVNFMQGATLGAKLAFSYFSSEDSKGAAVTITTQAMPLTVGAARVWAELTIPTSRGSNACVTSNAACPAIAWNGTTLIVNKEGELSVSAVFDTANTKLIGIDVARPAVAEGQTLSVYHCPFVVPKLSPQTEVSLCGVPVNESRSMTLSLQSSGAPQSLTIAFYLSNAVSTVGGNDSSCGSEDSSLGEVLYVGSDGTRSAQTAITTAGGLASLDVPVVVTLRTAVYKAALCVVFVGSCACCTAQRVGNITVSGYYAEGAVDLFVLSSLPQQTETAGIGLGTTFALQGVRLTLSPSLSQSLSSQGFPVALAGSLVVTPTANVSIQPATPILFASLSTEGGTTLSITGLAAGTVNLTGRPFYHQTDAGVSASPPIPFNSYECVTSRNAGQYFPFVLGGLYPLSNGKLSFSAHISLTVSLLDSFGKERTLYYAGEPLMLRVAVSVREIVEMTPEYWKNYLLSVGIDTAVFRVIGGSKLLTLRDGRPLDFRWDIVQTLLGVISEGELPHFDLPLRIVNDTRGILGAAGVSYRVIDGVFSQPLQGGLALSNAPDDLKAGLVLQRRRWLLEGMTTVARLVDVSVVQRAELSTSPRPSRIIMNVPIAINFTLPQAPSSGLGITMGCDKYIVEQKHLWTAEDVVDVSSGNFLQKSLTMATSLSANSEAVRSYGYGPIDLDCFIRYSPVGFEVDVTNVSSFPVVAYPQIISEVIVSDIALLAGASALLNITMPIPTDSFYSPSSQIGVTVVVPDTTSPSSSGPQLAVSFIEMSTRQQMRRYVFRVTATQAAVPSSTVCLLINPFNATLLAKVSPQCFFIAPPIRITVAPLPSGAYSQAVGEERAGRIVVSVNSLPSSSKAIEASFACLVPTDSTGRSVATFTPSTVRWERGGPSLSQTVLLVGHIAGAQCLVMMSISGGGEVQNTGTRSIFPQPIVFIPQEVVSIVPLVVGSDRLFPGAQNAQRVVVSIAKQPSALLSVEIVTNAPAGMVGATPSVVTFQNTSTENRTREVLLSARFANDDESVYTVWTRLSSFVSEFVQKEPSDGVAKTFFRFRPTRTYNVSVIDPAMPSRGHITDTTVYCGDRPSATPLAFRAPNLPIQPTARLFVTIANRALAMDHPAAHVRLYTYPAVTIFTAGSPLLSHFSLACDPATFPSGYKTIMVPVALTLEGPSEFGSEGPFFAELRRLEQFTISVDPIATVSSSRIYLDVSLSAPVTLGKELQLSLVTSCGSALTLQGEQFLTFAANEQQRGVRLVASEAVPDGCNLTIVQTADSKASNFEQYSPTRIVRIYPQARVLLDSERAPAVITDLPQYLASRRERAFAIPQQQARSGFTMIFRVENNRVSASPMRIERLALGIGATTSVALTSSQPNSEYLRILISNRAASVRALSGEGTETRAARFEVTFGAIPTPASVPILTDNEEITLIFSRYLLLRNDTEPAAGFSNYTFFITPEEVSIVGVQRNAVSAAAIIATALSPFTGPSLAPHFNRVAVLIDIGQCPSPNWRTRKQLRIDYFVYPVQADLTDDNVQSTMSVYLMAVIMNSVFILILFACHCFLVGVVFASRINVLTSRSSLILAMQRARFPGASIFALGYFAGIQTEFGFRTIMHGEDLLYIFLAVFFLILFYAGTTYCFYHVYSRPFSQFERAVAEEGISVSDGGGGAARWCRKVFGARGTWIPRTQALETAATPSEKEKVLCFTDRYGSVFSQYIPRWRFYLALDIGFSIVIGFIGAFEPTDSEGCLAKASVLCAVFLLSVLILAIMRPYTYQLYTIFFSLISIFELTSISLSVAAAANSSGTFGVRAANISMLVVTNMLILKLAVDVILMVQSAVFAYIEKRRVSKTVAMVGPVTGKVALTDFAPSVWWAHNFGASAAGSSPYQPLQSQLLREDGLMGGDGDPHEEMTTVMCDLDSIALS